MKYKSGYKYQLHADEVFRTRITPPEKIETRFIILEPGGTMTVKAGYAWDGPSGPTWDTKTFMRGSLIHDALFQLMRMELLLLEWRPYADQELIRICKEDGMWAVRRWWVYRGVKRFGGPAADPRNKKPILSAP